MASKATKYEELKAKQHRAKHSGGPGKPDYVRGQKLGEVKCRQSPVTAPELLRLSEEKKIKEVDSKGGFTSPAIETAKKRGIKLFSRGKRIA